MRSQNEWGTEQTRLLRYMTAEDAKRLMDEYGLSPEARAMLEPSIGSALKKEKPLKLGNTMREISIERKAPPSPVTPTVWRAPDPDRPLWFAAAWLCGASHSILAFLAGGITDQAVQQSISKIMPSAEERHSHRMGYRLSRERVEFLRNRYYTNVERLRGLSPVEAAKWLLEEEDDG